MSRAQAEAAVWIEKRNPISGLDRFQLEVQSWLAATLSNCGEVYAGDIPVNFLLTRQEFEGAKHDSQDDLYSLELVC